MKRVFVYLMLSVFLISACAEADSMHAAALKGPTAMGMVKMMEDYPDCDFSIYAAADEITPSLVQGQLDIAALPANLAAVLSSRTAGEICVLAVNTLGVLYIAECGDSIHSVEDLRGRTVYSAGKGSTPEYALNFILSANGLDPATDVNIEYKSEHAECLAALLNNPDAAAMLPQPFLTTAHAKAPEVRTALNLSEEWDKLGFESSMITGVLAARSAFVKENPDAVRAFLEAYAASVDYVNGNAAEAAQLVEKYDIVPAQVAEKAIPECSIVCITGEDMQAKLSGYLQVLYDQDPASVGGALPDAQFYYVP